KLVRVRRPLPLHPESFIEANGIDNERVAFPVTDRVPVVTGNQILRMRTSIHIDDAERLRAILIEHVDRFGFGNIHKFETTGRDELPWTARRLAWRVRFE